MTAEVIQLADRRDQKAVADAEDIGRQMADRQEFHDAFRVEMRAAFDRLKGRRHGVMDHLAYHEFEIWVADRIMVRKRMSEGLRKLREQRNESRGGDSSEEERLQRVIANEPTMD
ncbi:hypothetical protein [Mesorhizobium sp. A623]